MNILIIGDVVGQNGSAFLGKRLPSLRQKHKVDLVIANGENSAEGNGILPASAQQLYDAGVDIITLGNHALRRREIFPMLEEREDIIRPANFHSTAPGRGVCIYDCPGKPRVAVINLSGSSFMEFVYQNPFDCADALLAEISAPIIIVDFHAEATAEKLALGFYLDGRVSAVVGTHTHIQTADERILPGGTGYLTDLGMCGSFNSVLGVKPQLALNRFLTAMPTRFENDGGFCRLSGALLTADNVSGKTTAISRINVE
ncbi:MAG: TIGR00282 family metallophosphoesterase [Angelakisella sp.]